MKLILTMTTLTSHLLKSGAKLMLLFALSFGLSGLLSAQEEPIDYDVVDADIALATPGDIPCGSSKSTSFQVVETEYCTTDEELALDSLKMDIISDLEGLGWECVEPPNCPGTRVCVMRIEFTHSNPTGGVEGDKYVFKKKKKDIKIKCRCGSGFTDPIGPGEQANLPFPTEEPTFVSGVFEVFPNPASEFLQIKLDDALDLYAQQLRISSSNGKLIQNIQLRAGDYQQQINISELANGIYFLSLYEGDVRIETLRFVVDH
ncbi:MAG: T9SS type A sorting domain-containing protein [Bacteroidota bacterium]